jgi:hypothetical protein
MEFLALLAFMVVLVISAILARWMFRIDDIVKILGVTKDNLEDIKQQNNILIKQQDEIIDLLEVAAGYTGEVQSNKPVGADFPRS